MGFLSSLFGIGGKSKPSTQTVVQSQKLPPEIAPFVSEIAQEAKDLFQQRVGEGYVPYTGQTIAPLTPQEEAAMTGIEGLVGTSRPLQEEALGVTRQQAEKFTPETAEAYMSPYQRAVTDIEKREAQTQFERNIMPRFEASAVQAGGLSGLGSRAGVEAAELQRGQSQLLADIEAKGLQSAFQDARKAFEEQKQREAGMAAEIGRAGPAMFASGIQEAGALQRVGEERRDLGQSALDEAYFKFLEERQFPEQTLADYSGFIYGNPLTQIGTTTKTQTGTPFQPSLGQTLLGVGSTLGAAALRNPYVTQKMFKGGGYINRDRGLSGLPMFRRQEGTQVLSEVDEEVIAEHMPGSMAGEKFDFLGFMKTLAGPKGYGAMAYPPGFDPTEGLPEGKYRDLEGKVHEDYTELDTVVAETEDDPAVDNVAKYDVIQNVETKTPAQKENSKKIQTTLANSPKSTTNQESVSMTLQEAIAEYDKNPSAFGAITREQYLKDTEDFNKKYLDTINRIYPEGQNEFLADALQALGAMFVAENKGEAFTKTFNKLQEAGIKRRDARRVALGKAALENLKSDKATLDKIRQLPKQRFDAIIALMERSAKREDRKILRGLRKAQTDRQKAEAEKARRYRPKIEKAVKLSDGERKAALSYSTTTFMPTLLNKIKDDKTGVAGRMKNIISSNSTTADDIADEVEATFEHKAFPSILNKELESLRNEKKGLSSSDLYNQAALRALKYFKTEKSWIGTDNIVLR